MSSPATRRVTALQLASVLTPHLVFLNYDLPFQDSFSLSPTFAGILNIVTCRGLSFSGERSLIRELLPFFSTTGRGFAPSEDTPESTWRQQQGEQKPELKHNAEIWCLRTLSFQITKVSDTQQKYSRSCWLSC